MGISALPRLQLFNYQGQAYTAPSQNLDTLLQPTLGFNPTYNGGVSPTNTNVVNENNVSTPISGSTGVTESGVTGQYQGFYDYIAAQNYNNQLPTNDTFTINNGLTGLTVTTDASGNVTQVTLDPYTAGQQNATNFTLPDRQDILSWPNTTETNTEGIIPLNFKGKNFHQQTAQVATAVQPTTSTQSTSPTPVSTVLPTSEPLNPTTNLNPFNAPSPFQTQPFQGLQVTGTESEISFTQAQQLGTVNASLGVEYNASTENNLAVLRQNSAQMAYASLAQKIVNIASTVMPTGPFVPTGSSRLSNSTPASTANTNDFNMFTDITEKKSSSGSYVPFFKTGTESGGTGENKKRQPRRRVTPLSAVG